MKLLVYELTSSLSQGFKPLDNTIIKAFRPHIYIHNIPSGSLKVQILTSDDTLIAESSEIVISSITASNEFHGYVTFYLDANLQKNVHYKFNIVGTNGYLFAESGYVGAVTDYDLRKYQPEVPLANDGLAPLDFEIWSLTKK